MSNQPQAHVADERAAFEAHAAKTLRALVNFKRAHDGTYVDNRVASKWATWQAARAASTQGADVATWQERIASDPKDYDERTAMLDEIAALRACIAAGAPAETPKPSVIADALKAAKDLAALVGTQDHLIDYAAVSRGRKVIDAAIDLLAAQPAPATEAQGQAEATDAKDISYELIQDDMMVAGAEGPGALPEIQHYAMMYGQDGPCEIVEVTRRKLAPANSEKPL